jgi:hypothetical protein
MLVAPPDLDRISADRKCTERLPHHRLVHPEIEQRRDEHVPRHARDRIDMQNPRAPLEPTPRLVRMVGMRVIVIVRMMIVIVMMVIVIVIVMMMIVIAVLVPFVPHHFSLARAPARRHSRPPAEAKL